MILDFEEIFMNDALITLPKEIGGDFRRFYQDALKAYSLSSSTSSVTPRVGGEKPATPSSSQVFFSFFFFPLVLVLVFLFFRSSFFYFYSPTSPTEKTSYTTSTIKKSNNIDEFFAHFFS